MNVRTRVDFFVYLLHNVAADVIIHSSVTSHVCKFMEPCLFVRIHAREHLHVNGNRLVSSSSSGVALIAFCVNNDCVICERGHARVFAQHS